MLRLKQKNKPVKKSDGKKVNIQQYRYRQRYRKENVIVIDKKRYQQPIRQNKNPSFKLLNEEIRKPTQRKREGKKKK